jgi:hypothetical protein
MGDVGGRVYANTASIGDDEPGGAAGNVVLGDAAIQMSAGYARTCALLATGGSPTLR